jgi:eukaryotic-like serine/threonine-protein kinase
MTDIDRLRATLDSRYNVERELGAGGMATVYLAQDTKHHRRVAVKVLRPELAASLGAERFHREIEVAAQLQHPNILPLLDSGEAEGLLYYMMPFVEGESLRERLAKRGELPVHEAVRMLVEIVDALAHAHSRGVVHRDIKPDNILLSGRHALVTDFGVAKAVSEATGRQKLTTAGIALGTPQYMAPEQATADPNIDQRVDIYAIGCLAYELLTGRPPFFGLSPHETLAAQVTAAPDPVSKHRSAISPGLAQVVMRCLEKRPADRWQSADELLGQLEQHLTPSTGMTPAATVPAPAVQSSRSRATAIGVAAGVVILAAIAASLWSRGGADRGPATTLGQSRPLTSETGVEIEPAISPDGKSVAYAGGNLDRMRVYVRQPGSRAVPVTPDSGATQRRPVWSPDQTQLLMTQGTDLVVVPALGGPTRLIARPKANQMIQSATWSPTGDRIAYVSGDTLFIKGVQGGEERRIAAQEGMFGLAWSPDGRYLAFAVGDPRFALGGLAQFGNLAPAEIRAVSVETPGDGPRMIVGRTSLNVSPVWMPDSRTLLFVSDRDGARDVYAIEVANGRARGSPARLTTGLNVHSISVSRSGDRIAYSVFTARSNVWAIPVASREPPEREARQVTTGNQLIETVSVSGDGKRVYFDSNREGNSDIYRVTLPEGEPVQVTRDAAPEFNAVESPDGRWVAFHSWKHGSRDIFVVPLDGGDPVRVTSDSAHEGIPFWSPDSRKLSFRALGSPRNGVYVTEMSGEGRWTPPRFVGGFSVGLWLTDSTLVVLRDGAIEGIMSTGVKLHDWYKPRPSSPLPLIYVPGPDGAVWFKAQDLGGASTWWRVARPGAAPQLVASWSDPTRPSNRPEFGTDGRYIYTPLVDRQSDILVADLVRRPR